MPSSSTATQVPATQPQQPAAGKDQIAQVVESEFPTYDKDGSGALSSTEFASWMVKLKTDTDPATKADSSTTKKWIAQAFAQADSDKSKTVSMAELESFLSQGAAKS